MEYLNKMRPGILLALIMILLSVNTQAADEESALLDELKKAYQDSTLFEADFVQEKQVKFMSKPLISEGRIRFAKDVGLQWIIKKPLYSLTRVNDKGIFKSNDYYSNRLVKDPQMQVVAEIMSELLSSRLSQVQKRFKIQDKINAGNNQWSVDMLPVSGNLQKVIKKIEIIGQNDLNKDDIDNDQADQDNINQNKTTQDKIYENTPGIKQIIIYDNDTNITRITFSHIQIQIKDLDPEMIRDF